MQTAQRYSSIAREQTFAWIRKRRSDISRINKTGSKEQIGLSAYCYKEIGPKGDPRSLESRKQDRRNKLGSVHIAITKRPFSSSENYDAIKYDTRTSMKTNAMNAQAKVKNVAQKRVKAA